MEIGAKLGAYEVIAKIGEGGMGEVYRARDTKLKRVVAIKILPESVANDADRLARFQREAEVLATLNHPNIAAVYGLEDSGGIAAIVMELVEGESLDARLKPRVPSAETDTTGGARRSSDGARGFSRAPGGLPIDEALAIARLMAVAVRLGQTPEFGVPVKLFEAPINATLGQYSVASNGQRFLIVERPDFERGATSVPLTVLMNWTSGLKTN
jgi:hypothetical protein